MAANAGSGIGFPTTGLSKETADSLYIKENGGGTLRSGNIDIKTGTAIRADLTDDSGSYRTTVEILKATDGNNGRLEVGNSQADTKMFAKNSLLFKDTELETIEFTQKVKNSACNVSSESVQNLIAGSWTKLSMSFLSGVSSLWSNNEYTVPYDGLYQIVSKIRCSDITSGDGQTQYANNPNNTLTDNPDVIWSLLTHVSGAPKSRGSSINIKNVRLTAGTKIMLSTWMQSNGSGATNISACAMSIILISE